MKLAPCAVSNNTGCTVAWLCTLKLLGRCYRRPLVYYSVINRCIESHHTQLPSYPSWGNWGSSTFTLQVIILEAFTRQGVLLLLTQLYNWRLHDVWCGQTKTLAKFLSFLGLDSRVFWFSRKKLAIDEIC
eukprot:1494803-Pyramimonas_sp.AAC.2